MGEDVRETAFNSCLIRLIFVCLLHKFHQIRLRVLTIDRSFEGKVCS